MSKLINLSNKRFGRLIVLNISKEQTGKAFKWDCLCDCGKHCRVAGQKLRDERTISCGCYHREMMKERAASFGFKHGRSHSKIYRAWDAMVQRCTNPLHKNYKDYGGRGIMVCAEWRSFIQFAKDVGDPLSKKHTLERIDNSKGYEPGNVKWATHKEQSNNKRNNHLIEFGGITKNVTQWAEFLGIDRSLLKSRLRNGWQVYKAFLTPLELKYSHPRRKR